VDRTPKAFADANTPAIHAGFSMLTHFAWPASAAKSGAIPISRLEDSYSVEHRILPASSSEMATILFK